MPRPPRRAPAQGRDTHHQAMTTPTRPTTTNAITAAIPPFMLETPPHAPFLATPAPPSNNPGHSIVPETAGRQRNARPQQQTPTATGATPHHAQEHSQISNNALGSTASDIGPTEERSVLESAHHEAEDAKQLLGLRDISSLATWTLSSAKPGCGLAQLRHPSHMHFWQSDGPQPHTLTLHFFKLVAIVKMRIYLDFEMDESYTPTKMKFFGGMSEGGLVEFATWEAQEITDPETGDVHSSVESIRGWIEVDLKGVGGRDTRYYENMTIRRNESNGHTTAPGMKKGRRSMRNAFDELTGPHVNDDESLGGDEYIGGDVLKAMIVQVRICENHQNGKDTHVRGFQVFATDEAGTKEMRKVLKKGKEQDSGTVETAASGDGIIGLQPADWMGDPEIR